MISTEQVRKWNLQRSTVNFTLDGNLTTAMNLNLVEGLATTLKSRVRTLRKGKTLKIVVAEE
jgi:hypothetical protein